MIKKCNCGNDFENEGFKTLCPKCYAISKNGFKKPFKANKDKDIHRQVFVKVASEQLRGVAVAEVINYAKELEKAFDRW